MTLSAETRRMLELSRAADIPLPSRERAVRDRLIAELGAAALTGVVASTAVVTAQTAGATTSGALSASGSSSAAAGSGTKALAGATTSTLTKLAALIVAAGIGAGAWNHPDVAERAEAWSAEIAVDAKRVARRAWRLITGGGDAETTSRGALESVDRSVDFDERRHALLIAIARRPNRPVAKEAELVLILRAEQALVSGDDTRAAQYLDAHEMSFEAGALEADREALRVLVDCARGDAPAARARAARFVAWFASSDQLARLKACPFTASIVEERTLPSPAALPSAGAPPVAADESKFLSTSHPRPLSTV